MSDVKRAGSSVAATPTLIVSLSPPKGRRGDLGANPLRQRARSRLGRLVEDERELLAAVPGAHVRLARAGGEDGGQLGQHGVSVEVAVRVVDLLEVVEVDHQEGDRLA